MQFMVLAYDGKDKDALKRRLAAREEHLAGVQKLKQAGNFIAGGAILDDDGQMVGSTVYVDFESREALDQWLNQDPYVTGKVWEDISVQPVKLAFVD